ncbi:MAG: GIY-YIG nuclease family protein [Acidobacteria bacterium]|nr:GIY-YIG nuclease family protein [Acidobacteriota bacterium]
MDERKRELKNQYKESSIPMGIFQIRNLKNGKVLIGSSPNLNSYENKHGFQLEMGSHPNKALQADWKELGKENFTFEILDTLATEDNDSKKYRDDLTMLEELWLDKLQPYGESGYNEKKK